MAARARGTAGDGRPDEPGLFDAPEAAPALTVSELTRRIAGRLSALGAMRVEGELSEIRRAASGHLYFSLKDDRARIGCAIWRSRVAGAVRFELEEGTRVLAHGALDVYGPRGTYSLIVERLEPLGLGVLLARLEALKAELRGRGWFDRNRPLPRMPRTVGVVTSRDGAALRDVLRTRSLRWPGYPLRLAHAPVQGAAAAAAIAAAIARLDASGVDVIVVCRGGGSIEDLWAFNEEAVAAAIWRASVPVVSGVGHETDLTLADLVADHRAHTPTDAAQTVLPDRAALLERLERGAGFLVDAMEAVLGARADRLGAAARAPSLCRPERLVGERALRLEAGFRVLRGAIEGIRSDAAERLGTAHRRLERASPRARVERQASRLRELRLRLAGTGAREIDRAAGRLAVCERALGAVSPLGVLARGYSITSKAGAGGAPGAIVRDAGEVAAGERLVTQLGRGGIVSRVEELRPGPTEGSEGDA